MDNKEFETFEEDYLKHEKEIKARELAEDGDIITPDLIQEKPELRQELQTIPIKRK